ncbi:DUF4189 domain-containing protein [Xanthomonas melonis]|uniref:DUF4189 domain-containing protein n=1 Tax=Xanthomonas melonis TaxID=56456 RepID=A0ABS8NPU0_9XANT|nr:DUF4189 domain-containing protein [Xanthomonas melonis]MCD0256718.1 DUF4189 domain-containing protein [Xanthomonas melonis]MCD0264987.1 DUF4189 domain-containing protein [Xanthomonas melonis]
MRTPLLLAILTWLVPISAWAQGCPVGQYQIGGQGAVACAPIPQGNEIQQEPRPSGKWIKTWGAIANDNNNNFGVSTGKIKKADAEKVALDKCRQTSQREANCRVVYAYENRCAVISEPAQTGSPTQVGNILTSYSAGPSIEAASKAAISDCVKENSVNECKVIYQNCSEPIFKAY